VSDVQPARRALTERELRNVPTPEWEHEGRMQQGGIVLVVAPRGMHKTRALVAMLGASVTGSDCYGAMANRIGPVYAVIAEDLEGWRARWFAWRADARFPDRDVLDLHTWTEPVNLYTGAGFDPLLADIERVDPILIGLDTIADLTTGADENSQRDMGIVRDRLKRLTRNRRSVVAVHHTGHDESRERGSSVLGAMAHTIIMLKAEGDDIVMSCSKQKNGAPFAPVRLEFDPEALVLRPAGVSPVLHLPTQQAVVLGALRMLATGNGAGVDIAAWQARCVNVEGVKRRTFFDAKLKLMQAGRVVELDGAMFRPA
jgi:hypothetical protein